MKTTNLSIICDRIMFVCFLGIAFFLPISKVILQAFVYLSIVAFLIKKLSTRQDFKHSYFNLSFFAFLLVCFLSIFFTSNQSITAYAFLAKMLRNITLLFVTAEALNSPRKLRTFMYVLCASALVLSIDGIYQNFTHKDFIRNRSDFQISRIYATFPSPNDFGCYLICIIPFALLQFFFKQKKIILKFAFFGLFLLLLICTLLTASRGSWFAFIGSMLFTSFWIRSIAVILTCTLIISAFIAPTFNYYLKDRFANFFVFEDVGAIDRRYMWEAGWKMFLSRPVLGVGLGTFMFNFKRFVDPEFNYIAYAHNCYLQILAEIGLVGLTIFLLALLVYFISGIRALNRAAERTYSWHILLASLTSVFAYCIQMSVDTMFYSLDLGIFFWVLLGVGAAALHQVQQEKTKIS